jgi:hypothetical protein
MLFFHSVVCIALLSLIFGCAYSPTTPLQQRDLYLQQFIGQSSQNIQKHLDLTRLGYQQVQPTVVDENSLTYSVIRPIAIPLSIPQNLAGSEPGAVPIRVHSSAEHDDVRLQCKIIFLLDNHIAKSVHYTGPTC